MCQAADPNITIFVAYVSGGFALLGAALGTWFARRTEYEKWLRQERSSVFAEFLRQLHGAREKAIDALSDLPESQRDIKITELFVALNGQENIVRLYLKPSDRDKFSELKKKLWLLHSASTSQSDRIAKVERVLSEIQALFEKTIYG